MEGWLFEGWIGGVGLRRGGYVKGLGGIRERRRERIIFRFRDRNVGLGDLDSFFFSGGGRYIARGVVGVG